MSHLCTCMEGLCDLPAKPFIMKGNQEHENLGCGGAAASRHGRRA